MASVSRFDPCRGTVGTIYLDAQRFGAREPILVGDMSNEMIVSCLSDINAALREDPYNGKPFYVFLHEKRDLQMKNAIFRRVIKLNFRPWPEDDSVVFWTDPKTHEVRFCWALPHWSEMDNILHNPVGYSEEMIRHIQAWKAFDMKVFGFMNKSGHPTKGWEPDPEASTDRRL